MAWIAIIAAVSHNLNAGCGGRSDPIRPNDYQVERSNERHQNAAVALALAFGSFDHLLQYGIDHDRMDDRIITSPLDLIYNLMFMQVCAVGRAQASSVYNTSRISRKLGVPVWADGGIAATGHIVKVGRLSLLPVEYTSVRGF